MAIVFLAKAGSGLGSNIPQKRKSGRRPDFVEQDTGFEAYGLFMAYRNGYVKMDIAQILATALFPSAFIS
jgi:hypothetical protein